MAHTYMVFEFPNEEKAQQARHKLEGWKQAFRLDKKLQVKFDRGDEGTPEGAEAAAEHETKAPEEPKKGVKAKAGGAKSKKADKSSEKSEDEAADSGPVKLLVRLYFSGHEKITEKQWLDRIPADELFKVAHPHVIHEKDATFDDTLKQFDTLE